MHEIKLFVGVKEEVEDMVNGFLAETNDHGHRTYDLVSAEHQVSASGHFTILLVVKVNQ